MERENRREREWNENQLEGRNAVLEVLRSGRDIEKIMVQKGNVEGTIKRIVAQAAEKGVVIQEVSRQKLDELSQTKNHQGVIALVSAHDYVEVEDILAAARAKGEDPFIILLDGIADPHNLGVRQSFWQKAASILKSWKSTTIRKRMLQAELPLHWPSL